MFEFARTCLLLVLVVIVAVIVQEVAGAGGVAFAAIGASLLTQAGWIRLMPDQDPRPGPPSP